MWCPGNLPVMGDVDWTLRKYGGKVLEVRRNGA